MIEMPLPERRIQERDAVAGSDSSNRLVLFYVSVMDGAGHDFHELVWFKLIAREWQAVVTISSELFQSGSGLTRWISDLHSFNSNDGTAIIQVAEVDSPDPNFHKAVYTWRSLHLPTLELRTIQQCSDPFEPYAGV
jgi:hypothetical protein